MVAIRKHKTVDPTAEVAKVKVNKSFNGQELLESLGHEPSLLKDLSRAELRLFADWLEANPDAPAAGTLRSTVHYLANI